ncbi:Zinc finger matrin-type protein 5 [Pseudolycoriella hygida]|uniref:Zinc finger matrin-type protein 5 n=1 Tax=Pseudolycoriella hygida TaxID=35572 RepID=A0A9Q0MRG4_9DIPT|nr:Zinc finger matrin-type protein 5 [Pseudolycoriella hygida]
MGKNYFCDYCDKILRNDSQLIKKHIVGFAHTSARNNHFAKCRDPENILAEESQKIPCQRFYQGECHFGGNCRFSHYTPEEITRIQHEVSSNAYEKWSREQPKFIDENRLENFLVELGKRPDTSQQLQFWNYHDEFLKSVCDLPTSLLKFDPKCIPSILSEWG